ncbi:hypothetical protein STANM309S_01329 [Streptomyces tanashiensis]
MSDPVVVLDDLRDESEELEGGDANVGVWVRTEEEWRWLAHTLTVGRFGNSCRRRRS